MRLHIIEAENLAKKDIGILNMNKPDPYCIMRIGLQNFKTETFKNTSNPKWDACKEVGTWDVQGAQVWLC